MLVKRGFKFKLKPSTQTEALFKRFAGARRWVFNRGLDQREKSYEATKTSPSYFDQNKELTTLKKLPETAWLAEIHSQVLQQALKDLDRGFQNFFRRVKKGEKPGYPKFKKRGIRDAFRYPQGVKVEDSKVFLPMIGWVSFYKSRDIEGKIKETTITQEGTDWFISLSCEWEIPTPMPRAVNERRAVGVDVGVTKFATIASGEQNTCTEIDNPRFIKTLLPRLRYLSRQLSKKTKRSRNSLKAREKLARLHTKIKNLRNNFAHQLSVEMIKTHDIFCIESLEISNLIQKSSRGLSRAISDAGWRYFLHCLKYKAEELGKHVVEAGKYYPSSQMCAECKHQQKMPLAVREYDCTNCGKKNDRDYNSAIVLKAAGMTVLKACGAALVGGSYEAGILRL